MTIHPVVTATSGAASTAMNAASTTRLLLHVASPVAASVFPVPTVIDISLVCVDCRQFVGVVLKYSVTVVVVEHDGVMVTTEGEHVGATMKGEQVGVIVTTGGA